jgi:hypothetical protein
LASRSSPQHQAGDAPTVRSGADDGAALEFCIADWI